MEHNTKVCVCEKHCCAVWMWPFKFYFNCLATLSDYKKFLIPQQNVFGTLGNTRHVFLCGSDLSSRLINELFTDAKVKDQWSGLEKSQWSGRLTFLKSSTRSLLVWDVIFFFSSSFFFTTSGSLLYILTRYSMKRGWSLDTAVREG